MYIFALYMHIICAIIFIGYVFFDACIYPLAKKYYKENDLKNVKKAYSKSGAKIYAAVFLGLILSGIYLASFYLGKENGWTNSLFQILLLSKIFLVIFMIFITIFSIFYVFALKKSDPFGKFSHLIALIICLLIVFIAKIMFFV